MWSEFEIETEQCPACGEIFKAVARDLPPGGLTGDNLTCPKCGMVLWKNSGYLWLYPEHESTPIEPVKTKVASEICPLCGAQVNYTLEPQAKVPSLSILYCPKCDVILAVHTRFKFRIRR